MSKLFCIPLSNVLVTPPSPSMPLTQAVMPGPSAQTLHRSLNPASGCCVLYDEAAEGKRHHHHYKQVSGLMLALSSESNSRCSVWGQFTIKHNAMSSFSLCLAPGEQHPP